MQIKVQLQNEQTESLYTFVATTKPQMKVTNYDTLGDGTTKTIEIDYPTQNANITNYYSLDNGATWNVYTGEIDVPNIQRENLLAKIEYSEGITINKPVSYSKYIDLIKFRDVSWENGQASVEISSLNTNYIEYQVNSETGTWQSGTKVENLQFGDIVYARINDGTNIIDSANISITDDIPPEEFEIQVTDITYEGFKISGSTQDLQSGIQSYTYVAENNGTIVQEIPNQTVTEYPITGLEEQTEYVVYMLAYDNAGNVRKSNEVTVKTTAIPIKNMIGKPVNYSANGITDWKVFYGYDDGEIYLIKSDYLNKSKIPSAAMMTEGSYQRAYWPTSVTYDNIIDTDTSIRTRFLMSFNANKTNLNIMAVSKLLNTTTWSAFANGTSGATQITGGFAIGSPTYEMWVASWNEVYPTQKITVQKDNVGFVVPNTPSGVKNDVLYNTSNTEQVNALNGYFLASPSVTLNSGYIYRGVLTYDWRSSGKITKEDATNCAHTARPVVSIPSTYKLKWNSETNMYDIVEK